MAAPASDPSAGGSGDRDVTVSRSVEREFSPTPPVMSLGVIWRLMARHPVRISVSLLALIGCTTCTLSTPILSGANLSEFF